MLPFAFVTNYSYNCCVLVIGKVGWIASQNLYCLGKPNDTILAEKGLKNRIMKRAVRNKVFNREPEVI